MLSKFEGLPEPLRQGDRAVSVPTPRFKKGDNVRTLYEYSEKGKIMGYVPMERYHDKGTYEPWYSFKAEDGHRSRIHEDMLVLRND
jgi:hypothetical protein